MWSLGAIGFLQPLFLIGLAALPLLWLLLRATPPRARRIAFPGVRVLLGLEDKERTPQRTPWWLLLLRLMAAALLLLAFAEPLLNPKIRSGSGAPLLLLMDGGWASAPDWSARRAAAEDALTQAAEADRPVALVSLSAGGPAPERLSFETAETALERLSALEPSPWRPDPARLIPAAEAAGEIETIWIHDGLAGARAADADPAEGAKARLAAILAEKGPLTLIASAHSARGVAKPEIREGALVATALRADSGAEETRRIAALSGEGAATGEPRRIGSAEAVFAADALSAEAEIDLPTQLRNRLDRLQMDGERHAGAVALLDDRFRRRRVALVSGEQERRGLPLLDGLHYLRAALKPHASARETNLRAAIGLPEDSVGAAAFGGESEGEAGGVLKGWADAIILSDVGRMDPETEAALIEWVRAGGLLVRFAGPRLAALAIERQQERRQGGRVVGGRPVAPLEDDPLLPVRLRGGGRALGGALSWSEPQLLAPFDENSPFAGLTPPQEVTVRRQVLAQPDAALSDKVWARLRDGTPMVTARQEGEGRVVLFHVTANAGWSNLPLSGLFEEMMGRLVAEAPSLSSAFGDVSGSAAAASADGPQEAAPAALQEASPGEASGALAALWRPIARLDAFGTLQPADAAASPIPGAALAKAAREGAGPAAPPGLYEPADPAALGGDPGERPSRIAVNALGADAALRRFDAVPPGAASVTLTDREEIALKAPLLSAALALLSLDALAALLIAGRLRPGRTAAARAAALLLLALTAFSAEGGWRGASAQAAPGGDAATAAAAAGSERPEDRIDPAARRAALETVFGYVITGDPRIDRVSAAGLRGLQRVLTERTTIEPGAPAGVDLEKDEIAVYAMLYWPISPRQPDLSDAAVRRLNAFMRAGGLLVVDTRDAHQTFAQGEGPNATHMRRLLKGLDLPPLEPVGRDHVITRSFYLLDQAPGRWKGGTVWVSANSAPAEEGLRESGDVNDGVSPVVIGSVDWAGAWAEDEQGRPMFPLGRGGERRREVALRFGVNLAMYAYTGNYKSDQVHIDALLERLEN